MKNIKSFWRKYNGAWLVLTWLIFLFFSATLVKNTNGIPFPYWEYLLNLEYGITKVFLSEFLASVLLAVNQPIYFDIVHDDENLDEKCKTLEYRTKALNTYYAYLLACGLVLAFA
jgi:hypothetical protein